MFQSLQLNHVFSLMTTIHSVTEKILPCITRLKRKLPLFASTKRAHFGKRKKTCGSPLSTKLQGLNLRAQPASGLIIQLQEPSTSVWMLHGVPCLHSTYCWWLRNPANQLRLVVCPIIYKVLYGAGFLPSTVIQVDLLRKICFWKLVKLDNSAIDSTIAWYTALLFLT